MINAPIFIIGAARSGTKFLRDCLRADARIAAVPHDINYIWRIGQRPDNDDKLDPHSVSERQVRYIRKAVEKQARLGSDQILLEKTVSNSLRVPFVERVFPDARYVHLVRDGREVVHSAMKEWCAPPDYGRLLNKLRHMPLSSATYLLWYLRKSVLVTSNYSGSRVRVWGPRYPGINEDVVSRSLAEVCALQWQRSVESAHEDLGQISKSRVLHISYESLVKDKSALLELAAALKLDVDAIIHTWDASVNPSYRSLSELRDGANAAEIEAIIGSTLSKFGY